MTRMRPAAFLLAILALPVAAQEPAATPSSPVPLWTVEELARHLEEEQPPLLLDVRTPAEFEAGHLEGALHIPHSELRERIDELRAARAEGQRVVVYCRTGGRAQRAMDTLAELGLGELLIDVDGDYLAWEAAELPVERESSQE